MPGGRVTGWKWAFGDGTTAAGAVVKHAFASAGRKTVTLTLATDSASPTCREVMASHVIEVNSPPIAAISGPENAAPEEEALFDAAASSDPDGAIAEYDWDFGDGKKGTGVSVRHRFERAGRYRVRLTVLDGAGVENSSASLEKLVKVAGPAPSAVELPVAACTGEDVHLLVPASGIRSAKPADAQWTPIAGHGGTFAFSRRFDRPGRYDVTVVTDDGLGLETSKAPHTRVLLINRPPISLPGPQRMVCPGESVAFDGSRSYDPDGKITRFAWDFGDGRTAEGPKPSHLFEKPGTYDVRLTATDDTGSSCASTTAISRIVVNAPPTANAGRLREAFTGGANDAAVLDGSGSTDPDGQALTYAWQVADGTTESGERVRHLFRKAGDVEVKLTVTDSSGLSCGSSSDSIVVKVRPRTAAANN
jgi:PKD repeat protein